MMNNIWNAARWSLRSNYNSTMTDCPQRDERMGWLEDVHLPYRTGTLMFDTQAYGAKYVADMTDSINTGSGSPNANAGVGDVAPWISVTNTASAAWGDAIFEIPWAMYEVYGDQSILSASFPASKGLLSTLPWSGRYSDYIATVATNADVFRMAWAYRTAITIGKIATVLGDSATASSAASAAAGFLSTWQGYIATDGTIVGDNQTAYLLGFAFDMIPTGQKSSVPRSACGKYQHQWTDSRPLRRNLVVRCSCQ